MFRSSFRRSIRIPIAAAISATIAIAGAGRMPGTGLLAAQTPSQPGAGWPTYGGDPGGLRFSSSTQINRGNVGGLHPVWTFHTHAVDSEAARDQMPSFETTPVLSGDTLYLTSPFDV